MKNPSMFGAKELYAVLLLALISFFLFADQNLMAPNLTQMADEFGFGPNERDVKLGGHISFMFWVFGGIITLVIGYLNDFYAQEKGFSVQVATLIVMAIGLGAIIGGFVGGLVGNWLYNIKPKYMPMLCCITTTLGVIPVAYLLNYPSQVGVENPSAVIPALVGFFSGFIITVTGPNIRAMLLNINAPETRGSIFSLHNLADDLGKGFGPVVISLFIVAFGRVWAFNIANLFWLICGFLLFFNIATFPKDEAALNRTLEEKAKTMIK